MPVSDEDAEKINAALQHWSQGDVVLDSDVEFLHLADLSRPLSPASNQVADSPADIGEIQPGAAPILDQVAGLVMLTQTCDVVRDCRKRPFVEVAPLVQVTADELNDIRRLKRPAFAYVPATAADCLVADLDRTMTVGCDAPPLLKCGGKDAKGYAATLPRKVSKSGGGQEVHAFI